MTDQQTSRTNITEALRRVIDEVTSEERRWLEWWSRGAKGQFVWKREAVREAQALLEETEA